MNKKAEEEDSFNQKMQEAVSRAEFMELAKNLHRNFSQLRLDLHYFSARCLQQSLPSTEA